MSDPFRFPGELEVMVKVKGLKYYGFPEDEWGTYNMANAIGTSEDSTAALVGIMIESLGRSTKDALLRALKTRPPEGVTYE